MVWGYPALKTKASLRSVPCNRYQDKQIEIIARSYSQNQSCDKTLGDHLGDQHMRVIISTISIVHLSFFQTLGFFYHTLVCVHGVTPKNSQALPFPAPSSEKGPEQAGICSDCPCLDREAFILLSLGIFASAIPPPQTRLSLSLVFYFSLSFSPSVSSQTNCIA